MDTACHHGAFLVDNMSYYRDAKLGTELTAEADWSRRGLYMGPQVSLLTPHILISRLNVLFFFIGSLMILTPLSRRSLTRSFKNAVSTRAFPCLCRIMPSTRSGRYELFVLPVRKSTLTDVRSHRSTQDGYRM